MRTLLVQLIFGGVVVGLVVRATEFELRFVATAIHHAGWDREPSDYVFSEAGMIL